MSVSIVILLVVWAQFKGNMNAFTKLQDKPSKGCWDISFWTSGGVMDGHYQSKKSCCWHAKNTKLRELHTVCTIPYQLKEWKVDVKLKTQHNQNTANSLTGKCTKSAWKHVFFNENILTRLVVSKITSKMLTCFIQNRNLCKNTLLRKCTYGE